MKKTLLLFSTFMLCFGIAMADVPYRLHRADHFYTLSVKSNNIVFLGNSITNMHEWGEAFADPSVINRGISGAISDEVVANIETYISGHPKKVFLMIGTNDLGTAGMNYPDYPFRNFKIIIDRIQRESPQTEIYVESILPTLAGDKRNPQYIVQTNEKMKAYCAEKKVTYVDLWSKLVVSGTTYQQPSNTLDGVHLLASGYQIWCKAIEGYVGVKSSYLDKTVNKYNGLSGSYGERASYFGALPIIDGDILMIGEENMHTGEWRELLHSSKIKSRGMGWGYPGPDINTTLATIPVMFKGRSENGTPSSIFLMTGTADLNGSATLPVIVSRYKQLLDSIQKYAPATPVYTMAVLPNSNAATNATRYVPFNKSLDSLAATRKNVTFVDTYTPFVSKDVANTDYFTGVYLYGKGFAKLAEVIAPYAGSDVKPLTVAEAEKNIAYNKARMTLGAALTTVAGISVGDSVGQIPLSYSSSLNSPVDSAYAALADTASTIELLTQKTTRLNAAVAALQPHINLPKVSTADSTFWYKMSTTLRNNKYVASTGVGQGAVGADISNADSIVWKFTSRTDGSWNIVNRADGSFLNPNAATNTQLSTSATEPLKGWKLSPASTLGLFIICSGTVQLNQTTSAYNNKLFNWGSGSNTTDAGCQFRLTQVVDAGVDTVKTDKAFVPILTLTDLQLDGTAPFRVPAAEAAPVLAAKTVTAVIDFTPSGTSNNARVLVGGSNEAATNQFFGIVTRQTNRFGVQYVGDNNLEGWYTQANVDLSQRSRMVIVMQNTVPEYAYYLNGTFYRNVTGMGAYGYRTFGNVPNVSALFVGGLITSDNTNKYPFVGTIHSARFYDKALTAAEVSNLTYDNVVTTGISVLNNSQASIKKNRGLNDSKIYRLNGQLASSMSVGKKQIYIKNGKVFLIP